MPVGISVRGQPHAVRSARSVPEPEPEPEPEGWAAREGLGDSLLSDAEQGARADDLGAEQVGPTDGAAALSAAERLRRSAAQRRDAGVARLAALQDRVQAGVVGADGSRARYLFLLWLALLLTLLVVFSFLLAASISGWMGPAQTNGVILNDGGNVDVHHSCDDNTSEPQPGVGGCDCYSTHTVGFRDEWIEASELGQGHVLGDDDFFTMRLPFPFTFYGKEFAGDEQIIMVSSNGYFTFGATHYKYGNTQTIPHDGVPDEMCAVYWSDFDPTIVPFSDPTTAQAPPPTPTPRVFTYFRQADPQALQPAAFVVQWAQIAHFGAPMSTCTFEAILYETGYMSFLYEEISSTPNNWAAPSVGFEDAKGVAGVQIAFNDPAWPPFGGYVVSIPRSCHSSEANRTTTSAESHEEPANTIIEFDDCGLLPCVDQDPVICSIANLSNWCDESFGLHLGSMTVEALTGNPKYAEQYVTELCPVTCHMCEADAARQRAEQLELRERTKKRCSASAALSAGCTEWEECYEVGEGECRTTQCECMSISQESGAPPLHLVRDDCGICALPPSHRDGLRVDDNRDQGLSSENHVDGSSRYPVWNADMDCAGQCHGTAAVDQCGSCAGGITTKVPDSMLGCDGQCFSSQQQCSTVVWSPVILLVSATCIGFIMVALVVSLRRRLVLHILADRQMQQGANRQRHAERTEDLLRALATVSFDQEKEQLVRALGLREGAELGNCSICLAEYEVSHHAGSFCSSLACCCLRTYECLSLSCHRSCPVGHFQPHGSCMSVSRQEGDELMAVPACKHVFHADCMASWLRVRHTCPLCVGRVEALQVCMLCYPAICRSWVPELLP